jgi:hypothetical protein
MIPTRNDASEMVRSFVEEEHHQLLGGIDRMHDVAVALSFLPADRRSASVATVLHWVDDVLKPHVAWEQSWLCPQIEDRAPTVTRLVRFDHRQILHQADRLRTHLSNLDVAPSSATTAQVVGDLLSLEALLRADLERQGHFLMPLLGVGADRWIPEWRD